MTQLALSEQIPVRNPSTGQIDGHVTPPTASELDSQIARMRSRQPKWQAIGVEARCRALQSWRAAFSAMREPITVALATDTGRARESTLEVEQVVAALDEWCRIGPELLTGDTSAEALPDFQVRRQQVPYPLVGLISAWSFPLQLALLDAIPALVAGCAVVIKPSEITPRFVAPLQRSVSAVPLLRDVLGFLIGGDATGAALTERVDAVCFSGSATTGRQVAEAAARRFIPAYLDISGKDPAVVLQSADVDYATSAILWGGLTNAGQAAQSIERVYVAAPLFQPFVDRLASKAARLTPTFEGGPIGPIISARQVDVLRDQLEEAYAGGAVAHSGGQIELHDGGAWLRPTVLTGVRQDMKIMTEETYGPILPVMPFETVEDAIRLANDARVGLNGAVFAGTAEEAEAVGRQLDAGGISINDTALTAILYQGERHSFRFAGLGGGRTPAESIRRFLRTRAVIVKTTKDDDPWWFSELKTPAKGTGPG